MKYLFSTFILMLLAFLVIVLSLGGILLADYIKVNERLKNESWELIQDNIQLEQLIKACTKELKER